MPLCKSRAGVFTETTACAVATYLHVAQSLITMLGGGGFSSQHHLTRILDICAGGGGRCLGTVQDASYVAVTQVLLHFTGSSVYSICTCMPDRSITFSIGMSVRHYLPADKLLLSVYTVCVPEESQVCFHL